MLNAQIGFTAGKIWDVIGKQKRITLAKIPTTAKVEKDLANFAIGWLAREGKIKVEQTGKTTTVCLTESEQAAFDASHPAPAKNSKPQPQAKNASAPKSAEAGA